MAVTQKQGIVVCRTQRRQREEQGGYGSGQAACVQALCLILATRQHAAGDSLASLTCARRRPRRWPGSGPGLANSSFWVVLHKNNQLSIY